MTVAQKHIPKENEFPLLRNLSIKRERLGDSQRERAALAFLLEPQFLDHQKENASRSLLEHLLEKFDIAPFPKNMEVATIVYSTLFQWFGTNCGIVDLEKIRGGTAMQFLTNKNFPNGTHHGETFKEVLTDSILSMYCVDNTAWETNQSRFSSYSYLKEPERKLAQLLKKHEAWVEAYIECLFLWFEKEEGKKELERLSIQLRDIENKP